MSHYKPYPAYKDSGVEWIGQVPEHWEVKRLKHLISQCQNGVWGDDPLEDGSDTLCIRVADFDRDNNVVIYNPSTYRQITKEHQDSRLVSKGDILLEKSGGGAQTLVGANVRYLGEEPAVCSNFVAVIKPSKMAESAWLNYLMASMYALKINLRSIKQSTGIQNLDSEQYLDEGVAAPSLDEQATIAATLDRETARIDALIQKKTRFIELLKEKRQALITHAVTKGIDPNVKMKDSGVAWIGEVPEGWKVLALKRMGTLKGGNGFPPSMQGREGNEFPFYKVGDLGKSIDGMSLGETRHSISKEDAANLGATIFKPGALAWAKIGAALSLNRRRVIRSACCLDNNMTGFTPDASVASTTYCFYLLSSIDFSLHAKPGAVPSFSEGDQGELMVTCPSLEEQCGIVNFLDRETARIDALIAKTQHSIDLLKEKRQALITHAVTKGIDPNVKMKDSGVAWIGEVPEHWEVAPMKRAASLRNERRNDSPDGWTYIGLEDVEPESGKYAPTEGASRQTEDSMVGVHRAGDVLYGKLRPYLRKAIVADQDGLCSTEFLVLSPRRSTAPWLHRWLLTPEVTQQIEAGCDGAKMPRADWEHVGSIPIPLPPFAEQTAIATVIDRETTRIDALIAKKTRFIELLKEKRQALITHAVTKGLIPT